jgi:DNA-binding transcriptional LysR family regulator
MELRHIRYFIAVAEERNFTRAAARLGIGQPPLSQQIKDLERELGVLLFRRVPHGAELTEAGHAFLQEGRRVLAASESATLAAQRSARGESGRLRLGFTGSAHFHEIVPALIRDFGRRYPDVGLQLEEATTFRLLESLAGGDLDVAFTHSSVDGVNGLTFFHIQDEPLVAVLPIAHRCAEHQAVRVSSLVDDTFVLMRSQSLGPALHKAIADACRGAGFEPRLGQEAPQLATVISLVAAELGISFVPRSLQQIQATGVVFRPIGDVETRVSLLLACRSHERSSVVKNFVALARASARSNEHHAGHPRETLRQQ